MDVVLSVCKTNWSTVSHECNQFPAGFCVPPCSFLDLSNIETICDVVIPINLQYQHNRRKLGQLFNGTSTDHDELLRLVLLLKTIPMLLVHHIHGANRLSLEDFDTRFILVPFCGERHLFVVEQNWTINGKERT